MKLVELLNSCEVAQVVGAVGWIDPEVSSEKFSAAVAEVMKVAQRAKAEGHRELAETVKPVTRLVVYQGITPEERSPDFEFALDRFIDVFGVEDGESAEHYDLGQVPWRDWMELEVMPQPLAVYGVNKVAAAVVFEMTEWGTTEAAQLKEIERFRKSLEESHTEMETLDPEEWDTSVENVWKDPNKELAKSTELRMAVIETQVFIRNAAAAINEICLVALGFTNQIQGACWQVASGEIGAEADSVIAECATKAQKWFKGDNWIEVADNVLEEGQLELVPDSQYAQSVKALDWIREQLAN